MFLKSSATSRFTCTHIPKCSQAIHTKKQEKILIAPSHPKSSHFCGCVSFPWLSARPTVFHLHMHLHTHKHRFSPKLYLAANRPSFLLRGFPFWASNSHKFDLHHVFSIFSDRYQIRATSQISGISQLSALLKICLKPSNVELIGIMSV